MSETPRVLLISGSLRAASTNTALLRTITTIQTAEVSATLYEGMDRLPHFNPDDDPDGGTPTNPVVLDLRARIHAADAVLFSTPEYAGGLPGSFKNLLDWTVGGGEMYGKPVAWINASASSGAADAHASLRKVLGYTGAEIIEAACASIPIARAAVGVDGLIVEPTIHDQVAGVLKAIAAHVRQKHPI